ncbi:MAG: glycosyltransferase family 2 protein [Bacteroidaceae bacterium]|nr:glycosyltransferase family 2 protein [Bacteroidaceae bacterium]
MEELVSVIMPTYNGAKYIAASIDSIISQTYQNWELIITDDCSSDDSQEIIKSYVAKDSRIRGFFFEENQGSGATRNKCIEEARGRYLAFCDSDDRWLPEKLEKQIAFMQEHDYAFTFASYYTCDEEGTVNGIIVAPEKQTLTNTKRDDKIGFLTAIYDTKHCPKMLMPLQRKRQDWAYVLSIHQKIGTAYAIQEPLGIYRLHQNSISHNKWSLIKYNASVYQNVFGYGKLRSYAYLFTFFLPTYFTKRIRNKILNKRYSQLWQDFRRSQS